MTTTSQSEAALILSDAALHVHAIERSVAGRGCLHHNGPAGEELVRLEQFRRRQWARLASETDPETRAALWVVQLCGLSDDGLESVDRDLLRAQVPATSPVWALASQYLSPGLVYSVATGSRAGEAYLEQMRLHHPDDSLRAGLVADAILAALEERDRGRVTALLAELDRLGPAAADYDSIRGRCERFELLVPGNPAPGFDLPALDPAQGRVALADFAGRFLLLHFWGTWCGPCVEELPELRATFDRYRERGLEILSISEDDSPLQARAFLADPRHSMPWRHAFVGHGTDASEALDAYLVDVLPRLVLVGPDQRILEESTGLLRGPALEQTLAAALGQGRRDA